MKPPCSELEGDELLDILQTQGFPPYGVQMKITDDAGKELPWDGKTFGRLKVSGPAIASEGSNTRRSAAPRMPGLAYRTSDDHRSTNR